jgi:hypothetical protein
MARRKGRRWLSKRKAGLSWLPASLRACCGCSELGRQFVQLGSRATWGRHTTLHLHYLGHLISSCAASAVDLYPTLVYLPYPRTPRHLAITIPKISNIVMCLLRTSPKSHIRYTYSMTTVIGQQRLSPTVADLKFEALVGS